ncbi:hypothetical protein F5Y06DRAFT_266131 [Hypoxylon sp. FL0890]|nr:hypothetical protein F5Y06DRAFT_266131 [Hypoxylon sp. FL0890]
MLLTLLARGLAVSSAWAKVQSGGAFAGNAVLASSWLEGVAKCGSDLSEHLHCFPRVDNWSSSASVAYSHPLVVATQGSPIRSKTPFSTIRASLVRDITYSYYSPSH